MTATDPYLDTTRLEKVRRTGAKITARCPACHAAGNDRTGDHLAILPSGKFACAAFPGDSEHRREIFRLVGVAGERKSDPESNRRWRMERDEERRREAAKASLVETAKAKRDAIISRHPWEPVDVWHDSPQRIDHELVETDPRHFISSLFPENTLVWTGRIQQSGQNGRHSRRWRTAAKWRDADERAVGPMIAPATWNPGTTSRAAAEVANSPFTVLDFDGFDGLKPVTTGEIRAHIRASLAMIRWIREGLRWQLAGIVWTGSKSLHAWFHSPPAAVLQSLRTAATVLGMDAGLIGRPEHPCRLPGQHHEKTGRISRTIWLQNPTQPQQ